VRGIEYLSACPCGRAALLALTHFKNRTTLQKHQLESEEIVIRMTGCPNGCARPYVAEIGFVGTAYGNTIFIWAVIDKDSD